MIAAPFAGRASFRRAKAARGAGFALSVSGREGTGRGRAALLPFVQHHDESLRLTVEPRGRPAFAERPGREVSGIRDEGEAEFGAGVAGAARIVRHDEGVGHDAGRELAAALRAARALGRIGQGLGFFLFQLLEQEEGEADGILVEAGTGREIAQGLRGVFGRGVHMAPGCAPAVEHGAGIDVRAGRKRLEQRRKAEFEHIVLVVPAVIGIVGGIPGSGAPGLFFAQGEGGEVFEFRLFFHAAEGALAQIGEQAAALARSGFDREDEAAVHEHTVGVFKQGAHTVGHLMPGAGAALFHFVEHVAGGHHPEHPGLGVEAVQGLRHRSAHGAYGPPAFRGEFGAEQVEDAAAEFKDMGRGVAGHDGHGLFPQVGAGEPQRERQGERAAAHVEDERFVRDAAEVQAGKERGEADEVPRQEIAQIGRGEARGRPVGAIQRVAVGGEHGRKVAAGVGQVAPLCAVHGHDFIEGAEKIGKAAHGKFVGGSEKGFRHRIPFLSGKALPSQTHPAGE